MRPRIALAAALLAAALGCGNNREAQALDQAEAACLALMQSSSTLNDADIALRFADVSLVPVCDPNLTVPLPNETCAPAQGDPRCEGAWYYYTATVCSPVGGCCGVCLVRLLQSDLSRNGNQAKVCGSAFYRRQLCPL